MPFLLRFSIEQRVVITTLPLPPPDDRFRPAFYLALRDTLVAPDMAMAMGAAYQNGRTVHRVVSADGKLIDRSGAMTGGGSTTRKGAMRIIGRGTGGGGGGMSDSLRIAVVSGGCACVVYRMLR